MKTLEVRLGSLLRSAGMCGIVALAAAGLTGCSGAGYRTPETGTLELPAGGVAGRGAPFLLRGSYTLRDLGNGTTTSIEVDSGADWFPVRRQVAAGRYSISLNPGFRLEWLTRPRPEQGSLPMLASDGPKLLVVQASKKATVTLRSTPPEAEPVARR